jgi:hypothetical protein
MFNSLDPAPFWDRDLDREAAGFIEEEFSDKPPRSTGICTCTHLKVMQGARIFRPRSSIFTSDRQMRRDMNCASTFDWAAWRFWAASQSFCSA